MQYKKLKRKEFKRQFYGLNRLAFDWKVYETKYGRSILPVEFEVECGYLRRKDVTYIAITALGYIDLFGPLDDSDTYVVKLEGNHLNPGNEEIEQLKPFFEELRMAYEDSLKDRKEEES